MKTKPCVVCGAPSTVGCCFVPGESTQFAYGAPAGTTRIVCYGLATRAGQLEG